MKITLLALASLTALLTLGAAPMPKPSAHIDHVLVGAADLDRAVEAFEKATGVRPVYGGKHPQGTHNALVSLGGKTYLELIALQPGAAPSPQFGDLGKLEKPTPIGWAVSAADPDALRQALKAAGFEATPPNDGSRTTPAGAVLHWQTFGLTAPLDEAPFFIHWAAGTAHPSKTAPGGCTLRKWEVAGPHSGEMRRFRDALGLSVEIRDAKAAAFSLTLKCPKGTVVFS
jgi:hypothetical protein